MAGRKLGLEWVALPERPTLGDLVDGLGRENGRGLGGRAAGDQLLVVGHDDDAAGQIGDRPPVGGRPGPAADQERPAAGVHPVGAEDVDALEQAADHPVEGRQR